MYLYMQHSITYFEHKHCPVLMINMFTMGKIVIHPCCYSTYKPTVTPLSNPQIGQCKL